MFAQLLQVLLVILVLGLSSLYIFANWHHGYWKKRGIPSVQPFPVIGNLEFILRKSVWNFFYKLYKTHNTDYVGIYMMRKPAIVVQTPELAKKILLKDFDNFQDRSLYSGHSDPLGALNLFTVDNPIWGMMRAHLSPMFTASRLRSLTELMKMNSEELVLRIRREHIDGTTPVDLKELFSMYTTDTIGYTVFGLRTASLKDSNSPLWYITNHMVKWTWSRGLEFILIFFVPGVAELLRLKFFSQPASDYIKQIFDKVVESRKKDGTLGNNKDLVDSMLTIKEKLSSEGQEMSEDLMLAQAAVFVLGGIETSSSTLTYCTYELSFHPEIQERLYEEVKQADKQHDGNFNYEALNEMKFLGMCINETLRKYPTLPYMDRLCMHDYKVDENLTIEKGTPVFVNVVGIQYDEKYYPNPEQWNPERFTNDQDISAFTFLPFGEGPRFCIGKRYGMMQVRAALAHIVRRYRIERAPGMKHPRDMETDPYSVIISPKDIVQVNFVPRD